MLALSFNSDCSRACNSCNVRSGCLSIHSLNRARISALNLLRRPRGPEGGRSQLPVRLNAADTFLAQLALTWNRFASSARLPSPC